MNTNPTNGPPNGNGNTYAELARLAERSAAQQERLSVYESRIGALEELIAERTRGTPVREWIAPIGLIASGLFGFYIFGLEPVKDTISREIEDRKAGDIAVTEDFKGDVKFALTLQKERIDAAAEDILYVDNRVTELRESLDNRMRRLRDHVSAPPEDE